MRALLIGGAGFIGHHLARKLLDSGHIVTIVDNFSTGSRENLFSIIDHPQFKLITGDAKDALLLEPEIAVADVVYNLAASVGVQKICNDPIDCIENNTQIATNVLRLCAKYMVRTFMFSTSEVYGKTTKFPFAENDDVVLGPYEKLRWGYACSKLLDDYLSRAYFIQHGLPVTIVRLFNTIGADQVGQYGMVVPRFLKQAMNNEAMTVFGTGSQSRCFTDVRDVIHILVALIDNDKSVGELINIGTNNQISILDLAKKIKALVGSSSEIVVLPYESAYGEHFEDMEKRVPSVDKLKAITGYQFKYNLEDTLRWAYQEMQNSLTPQPKATYSQPQLET